MPLEAWDSGFQRPTDSWFLFLQRMLLVILIFTGGLASVYMVPDNYVVWIVSELNNNVSSKISMPQWSVGFRISTPFWSVGFRISRAIQIVVFNFPTLASAPIDFQRGPIFCLYNPWQLRLSCISVKQQRGFTYSKQRYFWFSMPQFQSGIIHNNFYPVKMGDE